MSDVNPQALAEAIAASLAARSSAAAPAPAPSFGAPAAPAGWGQQPMLPAGGMPSGVPAPSAVLVPCKLQGPDGSTVTIQLAYPGTYAANVQVLAGLVSQLLAAGMPVSIYTARSGGGWGGGGNGYGGGGYQRRNGYGGGYGGGGYGGGGGGRW